MPKKITMPEYPEETGAVCSVRINAPTMRRLKELAHKTRATSYGQLASMLLEYGMDHVELKPITLYDAVMPKDE